MDIGTRIPSRELERRWHSLQQAMRQAGLDCLIVQNDNQFIGGYVRYLVDVPATQYPPTVILPADGELVVIHHGPPDEGPGAPPFDRGVGLRISRPYIPTLHYTNRYAAEAAVRYLKDTRRRRIGLVGLGFFSAPFVDHLKAELVGAEFVDASETVDRLKAVKSEDELRYVRRAAEIHDFVAEALPAVIRPGRTEYEILAEVERWLRGLGSEEQLIMMGSAPPGRRTPHKPAFQMDRRIEPGDQVFVMVEANGPGGFYTEIGRTYCLSEPTAALLAAWDVAREAQAAAARLLRPGVRPAEVLAEANRVLTAAGFPAETRLIGHSQGYDLVERPALLPEETLPLEAGMVLAVHPAAVSEEAFAFCCDDFLVTPEGGVRLHRTPQEIFRL